MKPDRLPHPHSLIKIIDRLGTENVDLELFVLKCHLIVERQLYWLLAHRLGVDERQLPPLQFFPLARLALGGSAYKTTLTKVLALNDLRNEYGHELDNGELAKKSATLAAANEVFWPSEDVAGLPQPFKLLQDSAIRIAALSVPGDVWIHIVELSFEKNLYASDEESERARRELESTHARIAEQREQQRQVKRMYETAKKR